MNDEITDTCPFLVPVVADWLWLSPLGVYCRRPDQPVHMPADSTLANVCMTTAYVECTGYAASGGAPAG